MTNKPTHKITYCSVCNKPIEYTTKKPLKCSQCKSVNTSSKKTNSPRTKWKKETEMIRTMTELLPDSEWIVNGYYSWLKSPKGMPLQLDWYSPECNLAVE